MLLLSPFIPVLGPLITGLVAGLITGGGIWNAGKAGLLAGIIGAVILLIAVVVLGTLFLGAIGFIGGLAVGVLAIIAALIIFGILGFIGDCWAGLSRELLAGIKKNYFFN